MSWDAFELFRPEIWPLFAIVVARVGGLMTSAPIFGIVAGVQGAKLAITVAMAMLLTPLFAGPQSVLPEPEFLFIMVALEFILGFLLGFVVMIFFNSIALAGELIGIQTYLSMAQALDPTSNMNLPALGSALHLLGLVIFFSLDGHLVLISGLAESFHVIPPGSARISAEGLQAVALAGGDVFRLGVQIAMPITASALVLQVALGIMARVAPNMNIFFFSFPVMILGGMIFMMLMLPFYADLVREWTYTLPDQMSRWIRVLS